MKTTALLKNSSFYDPALFAQGDEDPASKARKYYSRAMAKAAMGLDDMEAVVKALYWGKKAGFSTNGAINLDHLAAMITDSGGLAAMGLTVPEWAELTR